MGPGQGRYEYRISLSYILYGDFSPTFCMGISLLRVHFVWGFSKGFSSNRQIRGSEASHTNFEPKWEHSQTSNFRSRCLGPKASDAHSCDLYRLGTRKQNNGSGHADSTFGVFLMILCRPTPTHSGPPMPKKKKKKIFWKKLNVIP